MVAGVPLRQAAMGLAGRLRRFISRCYQSALQIINQSTPTINQP